METADTGDILLFRGNRATSFLTRTLTWSNYDHVAMVLKFENDPNEVFYIESVGKVGVTINRWSLLRKHIGKNKFYRKCTFRHISAERDDDMMDKVDQLVKEIVGHKYGLNPFNMLRSETLDNIHDLGEDDSGEKPSVDSPLVDKNRTFFCSELVAKIFKILGIIENDNTPCNRFFPHHFSGNSGKAIKFTEGTTIETEC